MPIFHYKKEDLNYHIAKHHALKDTKLRTMLTVCLEGFPSFYSLQQFKRRRHGIPTIIGTKSNEKFIEIPESEELEKDNEQLQQDFCACQHFFDNAEMENGKHQVFNFKLFKLYPRKINKKLKESFQKLNCAAKVSLASGFILPIVDTD